MKRLLALLFFTPCLLFAQRDSVLSGAYNWQQPAVNRNGINSVVLLEGKAYDFEWMQLSANSISATTFSKQTLPDNQEQLLIVRSGTIILRLGDSIFTLTPNSVVVLLPGELYSLSNASTSSACYYQLKYKSKLPADKKRGGHSFVKTWESVPYKPNNNGGGRRDFFEQSTVMQKRFEMHVTTLKEGLKSHEPHTHRAEEIVLIIDGETEMQLGNNIVKTSVGGFYYLGSNLSHAIKNIGTKPATYFAIQFE